MLELGDIPKKDAPGSPSVPHILDTCKTRPDAGSDTESLAALWRGGILSLAGIPSPRARDPIVEPARHLELCAATANFGFWSESFNDLLQRCC